jgi:hypothetical protein
MIKIKFVHTKLFFSTLLIENGKKFNFRNTVLKLLGISKTPAWSRLTSFSSQFKYRNVRFYNKNGYINQDNYFIGRQNEIEEDYCVNNKPLYEAAHEEISDTVHKIYRNNEFKKQDTRGVTSTIEKLLLQKSLVDNILISHSPLSDSPEKLKEKKNDHNKDMGYEKKSFSIIQIKNNQIINNKCKTQNNDESEKNRNNECENMNPDSELLEKLELNKPVLNYKVKEGYKVNSVDDKCNGRIIRVTDFNNENRKITNTLNYEKEKSCDENHDLECDRLNYRELTCSASDKNIENDAYPNDEIAESYEGISLDLSGIFQLPDKVEIKNDTIQNQNPGCKELIADRLSKTETIGRNVNDIKESDTNIRTRGIKAETIVTCPAAVVIQKQSPCYPNVKRFVNSQKRLVVNIKVNDNSGSLTDSNYVYLKPDNEKQIRRKDKRATLLSEEKDLNTGYQINSHQTTNSTFSNNLKKSKLNNERSIKYLMNYPEQSEFFEKNYLTDFKARVIR